MTRASDVALSHLKKVLARDPMLRDILHDALPGMGSGTGFNPDVDVVETPAAHLIFIDLPGVTRSQVAVRLEGARLVISGERSRLEVEDATAVRTSERPFGAFRREFLLPADLDADGVRASLDEGILRVEVPRKAGAHRDVPVRATSLDPADQD